MSKVKRRARKRERDERERRERERERERESAKGEGEEGRKRDAVTDREGSKRLNPLELPLAAGQPRSASSSRVLSVHRSRV